MDCADSSTWSWTPALLQLTDPALPIGAYAHSLGLEGLVQAGQISSIGGLEEFLQREVLSNAQELDLPLLRLARRAVSEGNFSELASLDELGWATRQSAELRSAASKMGRQLVHLAPSLLPEELEARFMVLQADLPHRQNLTILALYYELQEIPLRPRPLRILVADALWLCTGRVKAPSSRPFGIQRVLSSTRPLTAQVVEDSLAVLKEEVGGFFPVWDHGSARHESAAARLFIS